MRLPFAVISLSVAMLTPASASALCDDQCRYASCDTWCEYCSAPGPYGCTGTEYTTCGNWGTCNPCASVSCNYQPTAPYATCGIDFDQHIWGTRLEVHQGTWLRDANGNFSCCPDKFVTRVVQRKDCIGVWGDNGALQCCVNTWGKQRCYTDVPNHCGRW